MQHLVVVASALLSLVVLAALIGFVLKRRPFLFVMDKLPGNLYAGPDDVGELISGPKGEENVAREGVDIPDGVDLPDDVDGAGSSGETAPDDSTGELPDGDGGRSG